VSYENVLWFGKLLNYQVSQNVNKGETCNEFGTKTGIGAHGLSSYSNYFEMTCARVCMYVFRDASATRVT
jgi:hypothetical protein